MKLLVWLLRGAVFVTLFGLAVKNGDSVELRFYLDQSWQAPLSLVLLGAFAAGAVVGLTIALTSRIRRRHDR
ncbi:MAG: LapA family protein [Candidatus Nitricoxidivorans perseverans]|uniref:LapA family protein n=1 Tax=Candidatus Nitricoxidivorans perseverans TaxID=2975601 RepID=A0AA49IXA0_9PROT|nr:MAG: LapA family protein [Candidatus Nitricoxidivorans perseverans]